ncbi:MAG: hypothetical protein AAGA87_00280 [Pseudomonadota bacterium]
MKTTKILIVALAMVAAPSLSFAMCSYGKHQEAAISCADGTVYDDESKSCVTLSG